MDRTINLRLPEHPRMSFRRGEAVTINFEGERLPAFSTEPVAVALFASGIRIVSRSMKFHRPRGAFCLSGSCASCLMRIDGLPNLHACRTFCREGMNIRREIGFPSAGSDLMRATDFLFPDKFDYHKMFARVPGVNKIFTDMVRSFSGLGELPETPGTERAAIRDLNTDILVIGAGPAGMAAALEAKAAGLRVLLVEEDDRPGGHIQGFMEEAHGFPTGPDWVAGQMQQLSGAGIEIRYKTKVIGFYEEGFFVAKDAEGLIRFYANRVILCTGAYDQNLPFGDNDLVGVFSARGISKLMCRYGVRPGDAAVIVGSGAFALSLALRLPEFGVRVAGIAEPGPSLQGPSDLTQKVISQGTQVFFGYRPASCLGMTEVTGVKLVPLNGGASLKSNCDLVIIDAPLAPSYELAAQAGAECSFSHAEGGFSARCDADGRTSVPNLFIAGEMAGAKGLDAIECSGRFAAAVACGDLRDEPSLRDRAEGLRREMEKGKGAADA